MLPLWEGYDEYSHFAYVQHLIVQGSIPIPGKARNSREVSASLAAAPIRWTARDTAGAITYDAFWKLPRDEREKRTARLRAGSDAAARGEDPLGELMYESQQPPLYYWVMEPALVLADRWSLPARVFLLRCFSLFLCSLAVPVGFATARRALGGMAERDGAATCVIAIVVCMPEGLIDLARIGNESLALLVYTVLVYWCVRLVDEGANWRSCIWIGVSLGCGLLTKAYFLTAIPVVCVAFAMVFVKSAARRSVGFLAASLGMAAAISGWWYGFIYSVTGDVTGQIQSVSVRAVPWGEKLRVALGVDWLRAVDSTAFSHIWFGGWSFLQLRSWMYHLFYAVGVAAMIGLGVLVWRRRPKALLLLAWFEVCFCACLAYQVTIAQIIYKKPMSAGWYLYCLVFAEVILICAGLMELAPSRRRIWAPVALTGLVAVLDLYGMNFVLMPYYLGLTSHAAGGGLPGFHPSQIWQTGLPEISSRVMLNSPYLSSAAQFGALWMVYLAATVACVAIVVDRRSEMAP